MSGFFNKLRRAARRNLGNPALVEEDTRASWRWRSLEVLGQDLGYALRTMRRRPGFTAAAVVSLTLGIGANVALFSVLDALLLERLPVRRPSELVQLIEPAKQGPVPYERFIYNHYVALRDGAPRLAGLAAATDAIESEIVRGGVRHRVSTQLVSDNYFEVIGVEAAHGRIFRPQPRGAAGEPVAVVSDAYSRRQFGTAAAALGATLRYRNFDLTVVGVTPPRFKGLELESAVDVWIRFDHVIPAASVDRTRGRWIRIIGRLDAGASAAEASAQAASLLGRPVAFREGGRPYSSLRVQLYRPLLLVAFVVALVLLITCTNLANLTFAGNLARERELAVRRALGASRWRMVRQLLTETFVLAVAGGALAIVVAQWVSHALLGFLPPRYAPAIADLRFDLDVRVLAIALATTIAATLAVGLLPALYSTRRSMSPELGVKGGGGPARNWTSRALIVGEIAVCSLLLMVAGVFLRTVQNLRTQDSGYREAQLLVADVGFPRDYREERRDQLIEELRARAAMLPDVESVGYSRIGQLSGGAIEWRIGFPGTTVPSGEMPVVMEERVSPGFLGTMGTRIVNGRDFAAADAARSAPVAIVNESFAVRFLGGVGSALGRRFYQEGGSRAGEPMEVVGVVQDTRWSNLRDAPSPMFYRPYAQQGGTPVVRLAIRTRGDLEALAAMLLGTAQSADRDMVLTNVVPFREIVNRSLLIERLVASVSTAFGALGLVIAAVGLYGVLAYSVTRRRREIGVRIAVGASPGSVEWMFLRESFVLLAFGLAIGVPAALVVIRLVSSMLYGVGASDPAAIASVTLVLSIATAVAAFLPARRAAAIDPIVALREE